MPDWGDRFQRNRQELAENSKGTSEGLRDETRADMCIPVSLLFMWGVVPSFPFAVSVAAFQKTRFWHSENENALFAGQNVNRPLWDCAPSQGPHACLIWPCSDKL
jgi:hypothetical protein